jgi:hypothetical protein
LFKRFQTVFFPFDILQTLLPPNEKKVCHTLYDHIATGQKKYKFKIDDQVRISKIKQKFEKGCLPNFSEEIFTISLN